MPRKPDAKGSKDAQKKDVKEAAPAEAPKPEADKKSSPASKKGAKPTKH